MKCERCGSDKHIISVTPRFVNDDTPDTPTELWNDYRLACLNRQCSDFGWPGWTPKNDADRPDFADVKITTPYSVKAI
jgi:hypothetical protein